MLFRRTRFGALALAFAMLFSLAAGFSPHANAVTPLAGADDPVKQDLLQRADTFRNCQEIYWCGVRRDGRARCGPTLRCRTCSFVRVCRRSTGCVWEERCRWGPYIPPTPQ